MNNNDNPVKVSRFNDMYDKTPKPSFIEEFVGRVKSPVHRVRTEEYRRLLAEGKTAEAAALKKKLPGVTMAGEFEGGRADKNLQRLSHRMMFDWDDTGKDTDRVKALLKTLPYVETVWTSISAEGVKAVVRVEVADAREYAVAYEMVAGELNGLIPAHPVDMACKNVGRYCSEVWDPEVYYQPAAIPFDWREEGERRMREEDERQAAKAVDYTKGTTAAASAERTAPQGPGVGMVTDFLNRFLEEHPFVTGRRHEVTLALGRAARCKNLSPQEQASLAEMMVRRHASPDFTAAEIESCIRTGYQYLSEKPALVSHSFYGSKVQKFHKDPNFRSDMHESQEEMSENSNELRTTMPHFPPEVYDHLPDLLARGVKMAHSDRERDMLLMGMMAHLSAALPDVRFMYAGKMMSPHFYFAGVSQAATGKGIVALAAGLSKGVNDYYVHQGEEEMKIYEERLRVWEEADADSRRNHRKASCDPKPEEPKRVYFQIPANSSKAMLYRCMRDNGDLGGVVHASEIDTLASAVGMDCGKQDDVLRAAFYHETVSSGFKVDGSPIIIDHPRLALCVTGTPNQLVALVKTQEDGLFSRIAILTAELVLEWRSAAPRPGEVDGETYFAKLGEEVLHDHLMMKGKVTDVHFSDEQWAEHTAFFSDCLKDVTIETEDSPRAVVLREGLIATRLAAVFTALRKCEDEYWGAGYRLCTNEDFRTAMMMVKVLIEHSLLVGTSLPELSFKALPLRKFHQLQPLLEEVGQVFSFTDFITEAIRQSMSLSTAKRYLKKAEKLEIVLREGKMYRQKMKVCGK